MFAWYQKVLKPYEKQLLTVFFGVVILGFVFSGVYQGGQGPERQDKDEFSIETPKRKWTRQEFDNLVYRWEHAQMDKGSLFYQWFYEYGRYMYAGENLYRLMFGLGPQSRGDSGARREVGVDICSLLGAAEDAEIKVTKREVEQRIKDLFTRVGGFDFEKYQTYCKSVILMEPEDFERTIEEYLLVSKYLDVVSSAVMVSTEDVLNEFMKTGGRAKAKYIFWNDLNARGEARSTVGPHDLAGYLKTAKNFSEFKKGERIRLEFLRVTLDDIKAKLEAPKDEEIQAYFDSHKDSYQMPVYGPDMPPRVWLSPIGGGGEPGPKVEPRYKDIKDVKTEIIEALNVTRATEAAAETIRKMEERVFDLKMEGNLRPDLELLGGPNGLKPETTAFFSLEDTTPASDQLGAPTAESAQWSVFFSHEKETAALVEVRTDKALLIARLIEKTPAENYLFTNQIRKLGVDRVAENNAGAVNKKKLDKFVKEFKTRYDAAYAEKLKAGAVTTEAQAAIRFDTFTTLAVELKLTVKETGFVTTTEDMKDVLDDRPFNTELFSIEANGDVRPVDGNSGQYAVQLVEKRPPDPDQFTAKRQQLEMQAEMTRRSKFLTETLEQYKKANVKSNVKLDR